MDRSLATLYRCHTCRQVVKLLTEEEIKCPHCDSGGLLEELNGSRGEVVVINDDETLSLWVPFLVEIGTTHRFQGEGSSDTVQFLHGTQVVNALNSDDSEIETVDFEEYVIFVNLSNANAFLEDLSQYLIVNGLNLHRRPSEKEVADMMPIVKIDKAMSCSVCLEEFEIGEEAREMPCNHVFHSKCILTWLEMHNTCPVCRLQMPKDSTGGSHGSTVEGCGGDVGDGIGDSGGDVVSSSSRNRGSRRRFHVPIAWPFRGWYPSSWSHRNRSSSSEESSSSPSTSNSA